MPLGQIKLTPSSAFVEKNKLFASSSSSNRNINLNVNVSSLLKLLHALPFTKRQVCHCMEIIDKTQRYLNAKASLSSQEIFENAQNKNFGDNSLIQSFMDDLIKLGIHKPYRWIAPINYFGNTNYTDGLKKVKDVLEEKIKILDNLFDAVANNDIKKMKLMNEQFTQNRVNLCSTQDGFTVLQIAAYKGYQEIVDYLLPYLTEDELNKKNNDGYTALHLAIFRKHKNITNLLIKAENNININKINNVLMSNEISKNLSNLIIEYADYTEYNKKFMVHKVNDIKDQLKECSPNPPFFRISSSSGRKYVYCGEFDSVNTDYQFSSFHPSYPSFNNPFFVQLGKV